MKSIVTLKKKIVKFFAEKGLDFLTGVAQKRMQEIIPVEWVNLLFRS